jgi:hypothetical protein
MELYHPTSPTSSFDEAAVLFAGLVERLRSPLNMHATHDEIERLVKKDGFEILRQLIQGHLDERHAAEHREPMVGRDGVMRRPLRERERRLITIFGEVEVTRELLAAPCRDSLMPLDAELNLPSTSYSFEVARRVAEEASRGSFLDVVDAIDRNTGAHVANRQAEELTKQSAADFDAFYETRTAIPPQSDVDIIVATIDGKGIVVDPKDLRPATLKAAEKGKHKLEKRLSRGEKRNRKRMATVGAVYSVPPRPRTPEEVIQGSAEQDSPIDTARPFGKRVWASLVKEAAEVISDVFQEAIERDPEHRHPFVVLVDGNPYQIDRVRQEAVQRSIEVIMILDIIHVIEYLWKAAWCLHENGDPRAETWVTEHLLSTLQGKVSDVAAGIRRSATLRELSDRAREPIDTCVDYLLGHKDMMRYDEYLRRGFPIATGVIEGACRHLIKDRMDITGARWRLPGAEAVLQIRALRSSGDLDEYWKFHLGAELQRNHLCEYANCDFVVQRQAA